MLAARKKNSWTKSFVEVFLIILPLAFLIRTFVYGLYQVPTGSMEKTMLVGERFFADKFTNIFSNPKHGDIITFNEPTYKYSSDKYMNLYQRYVGVIPSFSSPRSWSWGPQNWTKRVIAVPGDEVKGVMENDKTVVYLKKSGEAEFKKLDEPYLNPFPLIASYSHESCKSLDYKTYDPKYSFEDQPYYKLTKQSVHLAEKVAQLCGQPVLRYPGTPLMHNGKNVDEFHVKLDKDQYWAMGDNRLNSQDSRMWGPLDRKLIHGKIVFRIWSSDSSESWFIIDLIKHPIDFWKRIRWSRCFNVMK